jgi:hypothetical protein
MKKLLEYRDNFYFNDNDYFLVYVPTYKKFYVTKAELHNGYWYCAYVKKLTFVGPFKKPHWSNGGAPQFKLTTVLTINTNELKGKRVKYENTELTGTLNHNVLNNLGVVWDRNLGYDIHKKYGLPFFWNDPKNLELF